MYRVLKRVIFDIILDVILLGLLMRSVLNRYFKNALKFPSSTIVLILSLPHKIVRTVILPFKVPKIRYFIVGFVSALIISISVLGYIFLSSLPDPEDIGKANFSLSTHIYDRRGRLLYEVYGRQNRSSVSLDKLPVYVSQATVAIEDKDFYRHSGISIFSGILRALRDSFWNGQLQGGSTITQQLVKLSLLSSERTIMRKIKEAILALEAEKIFNKTKILELYINQVPYGGNVYGIQEASRVYFGKKAENLTLSEAAMLAGLPQSPTVYSPYSSPILNLRRRNEVLRAMFIQGYIDRKQYEKSLQEKVIVRTTKEQIRAPHFVFFAKQELEKNFGVEKVQTGGLSAVTTLDLDIQSEAEKILKEEIQKIKYLNVNNGAILVTRPATGEILAMVGSVDYYASPSGAYNVATAARQPGSSIKPIMYSLALAKGYTGASVIDDVPTTFIQKGSPPYTPINYDGRYHGKVTLRYALANSYNIPAVRVLREIGVSNLVAYGRSLGIESWKESNSYGLSLTLGGGEVTMTEMATAIGTFANSGTRIDLSSLFEVRDDQGKRIPLLPKSSHKVVDPSIAFIISDILSDNTARHLAFGNRSSLELKGHKVAVKTGTTDKKKDNWTIGYTPDYLVAVWVGNNDNTPMNPTLTSGITGAAPIWNKVMTYLLDDYDNNQRWFKKPETVVEKKCHYGKMEYFIKGTENSTSCFIVPASVTLSPPHL